MNKRGQAAMEFLMTYGWAIIVVLAAIGALAYFGVLSPSNLLPERTLFQAPLPNVDNAVVLASDNSVTIAFRNNVGSRINISDFNSSSTSDSCGAGASPMFATDGINFVAVTGSSTVANGDAFQLRVTCSALTAGDKFKNNFKITYLNQDSGLSRPHEGSVSGKVV